MNPLNKSILATLTLSAALALTACGSGSDEPPETVPAGVLADNPIGTCGDGVNINEYNAIQKTTTREQALAIVCDVPMLDNVTGGDGRVVTAWQFADKVVSVFIGSEKRLSIGTAGVSYKTIF